MTTTQTEIRIKRLKALKRRIETASEVLQSTFNTLAEKAKTTSMAENTLDTQEKSVIKQQLDSVIGKVETLLQNGTIKDKSREI